MPYQTLHIDANDHDLPVTTDEEAEFRRNNRLFAICAICAAVTALGAAVGLSLV